MPSIRVLGHAFRAWRRNRRWAKHEPETPYLADLLSGSPVCLHVGASDGRHSYVMTQVAPRAQIHAFEPSSFTFEVLKTCLAWHRIAGQVHPVHAAVSDMPGEMLSLWVLTRIGLLGVDAPQVRQALVERGAHGLGLARILVIDDHDAPRRCCELGHRVEQIGQEFLALIGDHDDGELVDGGGKG